jgi:hypothetical protein
MENYLLLRLDPLFQFSRLSLCDLCFLSITRELFPKLPKVEPVAVPASLRPHTVLPLHLDLINTETEFRGRGGASSSLLKPKQKRVLPTKSAAGQPVQRAASPREGNDDEALGGKMEGPYPTEYEGSLAPHRSTRLAENYVSSVAQQSMIKQLERKFASLAFPLPALPPSFNSTSSPGYVEADVPVPSPGEAALAVQSSLLGHIDPTQSAFAVSALQVEEARQPAQRPRPVRPLPRSPSPPAASGGRHAPHDFPQLPTRHQVRPAARENYFTASTGACFCRALAPYSALSP